jgi:ABC-type oligopeptide transport system substrate-binding subunit
MKKLLLPLLGIAALFGAACDGARDVNQSVLNRGLSTDPESLDPHKARTVQALDVLRDIGEGLMSYTANGELVAGTAQSWNVSADGRVWSFVIRENARWSNGDPVTAPHFEFSLKRLIDPQTTSFYAQVLEEVVEAVEASDERSLTIRLRQATPYFLDLLTHPSCFPVHVPSFEEHGDSFARPGRLVSNGAYVLDTWIPGSILILKRNVNYWNNAATAMDVVRHHVITQEVTELNRFRSGELHMTSAVPPDGFSEMQQAFGEQLHIAPYLGVYYYGFNLTKPPFKDNPALRQALSMAIDREVLVEKVLGRGETAAYSWVPQGTANYMPVSFSYADMQQNERNNIARGLYRQAGYGDDKPLQIELRFNTNDTHQRIALAVSAMWREVLGVETRLINEELQVFLANTRQREVTQVYKGSWIGDFNDAHTFLGVMQGGSPTNTPAYANDEYDSLVKRAASQTDPGRRRLYLEEAERVLLADHPVIPLYFYVSKHLVSDEVRGWGDNVLDYHYSQHLSLGAAE